MIKIRAYRYRPFEDSHAEIGLTLKCGKYNAEWLSDSEGKKYDMYIAFSGDSRYIADADMLKIILKNGWKMEAYIKNDCIWGDDFRIVSDLAIGSETIKVISYTYDDFVNVIFGVTENSKTIEEAGRYLKEHGLHRSTNHPNIYLSTPVYPDYIHLNVHSHYSIGKSQISVPAAVNKAVSDGMKGMALTDDGVMYGIREFVDYCAEINRERAENGMEPFKPIIGCEMYVAPRAMEDKEEGDDMCERLTVLAKNRTGYHNLVKLVSDSWTKGMMNGIPRTDHGQLEKYSDGLIVIASGCENKIAEPEIFNEIEIYSIDEAPILPVFAVPDGFSSEDDFLSHLVFEKAKEKYGEYLPDEVKERLGFELETIISMGASRYLLIVQDMVNSLQSKLGISAGPGRGSVTGCLVAYCIGITKVDPLKYGLLFERFLNPQRQRIPDIDLDLSEGLDRIFPWVSSRYGKDNCARIISFRKNTAGDAAGGNTICARSVHPCGFVISPDAIVNHVPIMTVADPLVQGKSCIVTQYDAHSLESSGLVKFDFLPFGILSGLKETCQRIRYNHGTDVVLDDIPLDDPMIFELFQRGSTAGIPHFESKGMAGMLCELHPEKFEDLVAVFSLYRPALIDTLPSFIARKNGQEEVVYAHPVMEKHLSNSYGLIIYQEQIMQIAQEIAGFTRWESDDLRRFVGNHVKYHDAAEELRHRFIEGGIKNGYVPQVLESIWKDIIYSGGGFMRAHATAYALVSYQAAYLKAHYPEEFMRS